MQKVTIDGILNEIYKKVQSHKITNGCYVNRTKDTNKKADAYGCADAVNLLYTLNKFPKSAEERAAHIEALQSLQDKSSGMFITEGVHHVMHTTAHCVSALELLDASPLYPLRDAEPYKDINEVFSVLDGIDWLHCGKGAHFGAGVYAALVNTASVNKDWTTEYFKRLTEVCDSESGLWKKEPTNNFPKRLQIGDTFHYLFNYGYEKEPIPYPEALIDSCLEAYKNGDMGKEFGKQFHYIEMDWVYCLNRASQQTPHRFYEIKQVIESFAEQYLSYLSQVDWETEEGADDLHLCFGVCCALAELQRALPGKLQSSVPLRLVLDRRPFI
jgi:hypothetical protein